MYMRLAGYVVLECLYGWEELGISGEQEYRTGSDSQDNKYYFGYLLHKKSLLDYHSSDKTKYCNSTKYRK